MLYVHESWIPEAPSAVFAFHEDGSALSRLVPPWEPVEVVQPRASLLPGTRVLLRMRLGPLRFLWEAEHTLYQKDVLFQDRMVRGPFRSWVHTHRFLPDRGGTILRDEVEYALPLFALPAAAIIRRRLRRMFEFRHAATAAAVLEGRKVGNVPP